MDTQENLPGPSWTEAEILAGKEGSLHPDAVKGIEAYNKGDYFLAHEELETAWRDERGPVRDVYRGILQVGLAYYHIQRGNYNGAVKMFRRCKPWLAPFPDNYRGIYVNQLRLDMQKAETELLLLGPERMQFFSPALMTRVTFSADTRMEGSP